MDRQLIKTLIDALQASGLSELEYSRNGETLRLCKGTAVVPRPVASSPPKDAPCPAPARAPAGSDAVQAPLYGVVHLGPVPGAAPFVAAGQGVETGQVLCTVEAMKVFTEVRADRAGIVDAVLVTDGQEVEPGQALIRIR